MLGLTPEDINFVVNIINLVCYAIVGLVFLATVIVRLFAKKKVSDVDKVSSKILNLLHLFPTFGKNPRTKALEAIIRGIIEDSPNGKTDNKEETSKHE